MPRHGRAFRALQETCPSQLKYKQFMLKCQILRNSRKCSLTVCDANVIRLAM